MKLLKIIALLICFLFQCCDVFQRSTLIFSIMGDVPRNAREDTILQKQIIAHNKYSDSEFMVHLGDIKSGSTPCDEKIYIKVANYLKALYIPTFIVPGDNEWNDCTDPQAAWIFWIKHFTEFEKNWKNHPKVDRQQNRKENFAWIYKDVLLIGINLVGGRIHDQEEWNRMLRNGAVWIKKQYEQKGEKVNASVIFAQANPNETHELFVTQFRKHVRNFKKPVLFIHGDGHRWLHDDPWLESNMIRVQVDKGGIALPLQVRVTFDKENIFEFERNPFSLDDQISYK